MLFDLRGRGRRRTVQVIYLSLALLLGGGLVLFGIGGDVSGGLVDAFREDSGSSSDLIEEEADKVRDAAKARPTDPAIFARLAEQEYRVAGTSDGFSEQKAATGEPAFTGESLDRLQDAERAWDKHLQLAGDKPSDDTAAIARLIFAETGLNKPEKAVRAQEIVIDGNPNPGVGDYSNLAVLAYQAGQTRKGDLAAEKAVELAPKNQKKEVKAQLDALKAQVATEAAQNIPGQAGGAPAPSGE